MAQNKLNPRYISQYTSQSNWVSKKNYIVLILAVIAVPIIGHAGGLGMAALLAICAILTLIGEKKSNFIVIISNTPVSIWIVIMLLIWGLITSLWSPYQPGELLSNPVKLLIGVPLFLWFGAIMKRNNHKSLRRLIILFGFLSVSVFLVDYFTHFGLTRLLDPIGVNDTVFAKYSDTLQNLGHGLIILTLIVFPIIGILWDKGISAKLAALLLPILVIMCSYKGLLDISMIAIVLGGLTMLIAVFSPRLTLWLSFIIAICTIIFAPILAYFAKHSSAEFKQALRGSWEERLENWGYLYSEIMNHPLFGNGFDAARTYSEKHFIHGFDRAIVSMHPHNAGIHIWLELGAAGAIIASVALFFTARHLSMPGRLSKPQMVVTSGFVVAVTLIASISFGVWQDWWWASIIYAASLITLMNIPTKNNL